MIKHMTHVTHTLCSNDEETYIDFTVKEGGLTLHGCELKFGYCGDLEDIERCLVEMQMLVDKAREIAEESRDKWEIVTFSDFNKGTKDEALEDMREDERDIDI